MFVGNYNRLAVTFIECFDYSQAPMVTIISGKEGMGKTAHLHYLLQRVRKSVNHTAFIDAQKFVSRYAFAASNGTLSAFRKNIRSNKLLLLDNIQELQGKKKSIEELFHTMDTIFAQGGKAVITYRGDHVNLDFLGPRFASRLTSGLVIRLQDASEEEKSEFLQYYLLASDKTTDVESELISKAKNFKQVIEVANAIETCQDNDVSIICRLGSFEDKLKIVVSLVCGYYGVQEGNIFSGSKKTEFVTARYMIYLLLHEIFQLSLKEISVYFNRDYGTLKKGCSQIKLREVESYETLAQKTDNLLKNMYERGYPER